MRLMTAAMLAWAGLSLCLPVDAAAGVRIYLHSTASFNGEEALLGKLAAVEGGPADVMKVRETVIPPAMVKDGYFDRSELEELLRGTVSGPLTIYGSAVRVRVSGLEESAAGAEKKALVKSGEAVAVRVKKNGVLLECAGSLLGDGNAGDTVEVRIRGSKSLRGRLTGNKTVELEL